MLTIQSPESLIWITFTQHAAGKKTKDDQDEGSDDEDAADEVEPDEQDGDEEVEESIESNWNIMQYLPQTASCQKYFLMIVSGSSRRPAVGPSTSAHVITSCRLFSLHSRRVSQHEAGAETERSRSHARQETRRKSGVPATHRLWCQRASWSVTTAVLLTVQRLLVCYNFLFTSSKLITPNYLYQAVTAVM